MSQHKRVGGENGSGNGRGSVNGKERTNGGELVANFFFLDIEESSNVLNHLLMGKGQVTASRAVWRRGSDNVGGVASTIGRRGGARWNEDGRG